MSETADLNSLNSGRTFVWHEVYSATTAAAVDFYTKALDFGTMSMSMGEMGDYHMLTKNGIPVAGVLGTTENPMMAGVPPHWAVYIGVDNLDAKVALCVELGATVMVPTITVPTIGRMSLITDPNGANVWLFEPEMPTAEPEVIVIEEVVPTVVVVDEVVIVEDVIAEEILEEAIAEAVADEIILAEMEAAEEAEEEEEEEEVEA